MIISELKDFRSNFEEAISLFECHEIKFVIQRLKCEVKLKFLIKFWRYFMSYDDYLKIWLRKQIPYK